MPTVLLLLPSATYRASDFIDAARAIGADVVVASTFQQTLADVMGDRSLVVDLRDGAVAARQIVEHAGRIHLDAVVGVDEQGVLAAALASEALGLRGNPPPAVARTRDKAAMRAALAGGGVAQPAFAVATRPGDAPVLASELGFPCVLKPVSLSGSRGVIRVDDVAAAAAAESRIREILGQAGRPSDEALLVEEYLDGDEIAVEGLLSSGALEVLAVFDKPDPLRGPFFEETLYVTPSRHDPALLSDAVATVQRATEAIGLTEGPVHAELRCGPQVGRGAAAACGGCAIVEVAARSIGGLCSRALHFGAGISLEEVILRHALGMPLDALDREEAASGVMMLPIPARGVLRSVGGRERALAVPGVVGLEIGIPIGRPVVPLPEGDRYLGFAFARAAGPAEVEHALRTAATALEIDITPGEEHC